MSWVNNIKIRTKLLIAFMLIILLTSIVALVGIFGMSDSDSTYKHLISYPNARYINLLNAKYEINEARRAYLYMGAVAGDSEAVQNSFDASKAAVERFKAFLEENRQNLINDPSCAQEIVDARSVELDDTIATADKFFNTAVTALYNEAKANGLKSEELTAHVENSTGVRAQIIENLDTLMAANAKTMDATIENASAHSNNLLIILIIISSAVAMIGITFAVLIANAIVKPVKKLVDASVNIANGKLDVVIDTSAKDEIGILSGSIANVVSTVNVLIEDLGNLATGYSVYGDIDGKIDTKHYKGEYINVASKINDMISIIMNDILGYISCVNAIGDGNFSRDMPPLPGKKRIMNESLDKFKTNIMLIRNTVSELARDATEGHLSARADMNSFKGEWAELMKEMNNLLAAIIEPINEADDVLELVSAGNFEQTVKGSYNGDFLKIKDSINATVTNISSYIDEISQLLTGLANNDLNQEITRDYVGSFGIIKGALNNIFITLNKVIGEISASSVNVAAGAKMITESSMAIATGNSRQASAVQELSATAEIINEKTVKNAESARNAETLSETSKINAAQGSTDMQNMLKSMDEIKGSSEKVSKIIKVIEDIALQTNLLALNASVEAARAGEYEKGFAVVADEVRTLASRSKEAADETNTLIIDTITKINDGMKTAAQTSDALNTIVDDVDKVGGIITDISRSSAEQASSISQINIGLNQITGVVQENSSTSEETASAAEELSSQSEVMNELVNVFRLKARG